MKEDFEASVLLVEDSPSLSEVYKGYLGSEKYRVDAVETGADTIKKLKAEKFDLVLLDLRLPDMNGMEVLRWVHESGIECEVVIITAHGSIDSAVEAMRYGATDFISKPFDATRLRVTVDNVLERRRLSTMVSQYEQTFDRAGFHNFIGSSLQMQAVYRIIESAAPSKATVFITGASGTGKELCAEAIHLESPRRNKEFVPINCAAIPRDLMESEIFGHVKGAFTGAVNRRDGAATRADGGTLFLDEICEMDLDLQSKLLRFIQTGRFLRVGDTAEQEVDIRIVCATNRNPFSEVKAGRFREDLYYRLNVIPIELPLLKDRGSDILLIARELLQRISAEEGKSFKKFSKDARDALAKYAWPGNVRELENVLRNIVVLQNTEQVEFDMLPAEIRQSEYNENSDEDPADPIPENIGATAEVELPCPAPGQGTADIRPLWMEEKEVIERAVNLCEDNVAKAAAMLGISASTIYRKRMQWEKLGG